MLATGGARRNAASEAKNYEKGKVLKEILS